MTPKNEKQYFAFISYKREDQKWAQWLQEKLEHYKLPTNLNGKTDLPKEIRPVFRDKSELAAGVLAHEIHRALEQSKYLILICSRNAARSEWVNKEVQTFIDMGRTDMIIPFIIEDTTNPAITVEDCFPRAIKDLPSDKELLGVNINEMGRDAAAVKVVAHMFGLKFDDLWQRHERERKRRRYIITSAIIVFAMAILGVAGWIAHQNVMLREQRWSMMESQSKLVAEMIRTNADKDSYVGRKIALEILPKKVSNPVDWPYTTEAEHALRTVSMHNSAVLNGHTEGVNAAMYSPDGKQILSSSWDGTLKIWDVETGDVVNVIERNTWNNRNASFSPDGRLIMCTSDSIITVYDAKTGDELNNIINDWWVLSANFMPDGKHVIATSGDNNIRVVDVETGEVSKTISGNCDYYTYASVSPDGTKIVCTPTKFARYVRYRNSIGIDFSDSLIVPVKVLDYETDKELLTLKGHKYCVSTAVFSPDGARILTGSYDMTAKVWDAATGKELVSMQANNSSVEAATFSRDGKKIVTISLSTDKPVMVWDAATGKEIETFSGHLSDVNSAYFSLDGKQLVTASEDKTIRIWDLNDDREKQVWVRNRNNAINWNEVMSADGKLIISSNDGCDLIVTSTETGKEMLVLHHNKYVNCAAISPDNKIIVASSDDKLYFWNAESGYNVHIVDRNTAGINSVAFHPNGGRFVSTSAADYSVRIWDSRKGEEIMSLLNGNSYLNNAVYSPDGKKIALGAPMYSDDIIVESETGEILHTLTGHVAQIMHAAFSPDGKNIVTASFDFTLKVWNAKTGEEIKTLTGPTDVVMYVAYSQDGKKIVAACGDNTIRVWDTKTWDCVLVLEGHTHGVKFASFTEDGRHIISAAQDSTIRKWDFLPLQELIDGTRERFKSSPLTDEDRKSYYLE